MKKLACMVVFCVLTGLPSGALAYRPTGWLWFQWPYAYDLAQGGWVYFSESDTQWCNGLPPAAGWSRFGESGLADGWSYWAWPYAYGWDATAWFYLSESDTQWCQDMESAQWSRLGVTDAPDGLAPIPAGSFQMGNAMGSAEGDSGELPVHTVTVSGFSMDPREVSKAKWDSVRSWATAHGYSFDNAGTAKASDHPVVGLNWYDCVKWCNARSEQEGRTPAYYTTSARTTVYRSGTVDVSAGAVRWDAGYRLATEAEWERGARGGVAGHRFPWSDGDTISHVRANYFSFWVGGTPFYRWDESSAAGRPAAYASGAEPYTSPCGALPANGYGLYEMAGNAFEWCWDWYAAYAAGSVTDPRGPSSGVSRVLRGGSWAVVPDLCRTSARTSDWPGNASGLGLAHVGFRCVLP